MARKAGIQDQRRGVRPWTPLARGDDTDSAMGIRHSVIYTTKY